MNRVCVKDGRNEMMEVSMSLSPTPTGWMNDVFRRSSQANALSPQPLRDAHMKHVPPSGSVLLAGNIAKK